MSHTATIKAIKIQSISALRAAVQEMATKKGIKCSLIENATPRAYFANQTGMGKADYVLKLDDAPYDIGFYKDAEGNYEARTDFWASKVEQILGAKACTVATKEQARLGVMFQSYGIHSTLEHARKQGWTARRAVKADGSEHVILTGM